MKPSDRHNRVNIWVMVGFLLASIFFLPAMVGLFNEPALGIPMLCVVLLGCLAIHLGFRNEAALNTALLAAGITLPKKGIDRLTREEWAAVDQQFAEANRYLRPAMPEEDLLRPAASAPTDEAALLRTTTP